MLDILRALLGRWACPWCRQHAVDAWLSKLQDRLLPHWYPAWMIRYDGWTGRTGIPIHQRHAPNFPEG